jgi:hypothetical protein
MALLVQSARGALAEPSDSVATPSADEKTDDRQCTSYGAKAGSEAYVQCRLKLVELRQQRDASSSRPMRCRTIAFGGIMRTRCK